MASVLLREYCAGRFHKCPQLRALMPGCGIQQLIRKRGLRSVHEDCLQLFSGKVQPRAGLKNLTYSQPNNRAAVCAVLSLMPTAARGLIA